MKLHLLMSASVLTFAAANPALAADDVAAAVAAAPTVYGRVLNAEGAPLAGAEIIVRGSGARAVSDANGQFILTVPEGQTTFDVRYIGFPTVAQTVSATGGEAVSLSVTLGIVDASSLEDVIVTGVITDGVARSLNQQRNADGTINVLSADAIGRYPDPNVAESLQRVAGIAIQRDQGEGRYINVRGAPSAFTAVSVDGVTVPAVDPGTRAVDLDTLPSDIVSNIEVSKTLLPSQDADSIAGAVNIRTRSPFDRRRLVLNGYAGGSYNDYGGSDTRAGLTVSNVFGANETFGALVSLSYSETNRRPENIENAWVIEEQGGADVFALEETLFKQYATQRTRQALTTALEWRPSDQTRLFVRGSYADFEDDEYRNTLILAYADGTLQAGATDTTGTWTGARIYRSLRHRTQNNEIITLVAGAEHTFDNGMSWDADLSWADSEQTYPNRNELVYRSSSTTLSYDTANHYAPSYFYAPGNPIFGDTATGFFATPSNFSFRENTFRSNTTQQEDVAFRTNLEIPSQFGGVAVDWKFGLKFSTRDVTADEERQRNRDSSANPGTLASLWGDQQGRNFGYILGTQYDNALVDAYLAAARAASPRRMPDSLTADYEAREDILAGYGQARFDIGATNVIVGLRVEQSDFDGSAPTVIEGAISTASVNRDDTQFFPNLTVRHSFSDNLIGRFALTRSISRPEFSQIVPRRIEETDGTNISYEIGNPDLEPTLSNNVDVGLEYYFASLGVVSANAFYKDLTDYRYILKYEDTVTIGGSTFDADFETPINAPDGHLMGLELNWQQKFGFLPGWMSGFGVFANFTVTDAEIKTAQSYGGRDTFALPGQSDTNYNAAVFYEMDGFSARLSYTKRSDYLEEINADTADLDLYVEGREQLDFTASYDFGNGVELFGEAKNLTDSAGVRYYGSRERTYEYEKFGYNVFVGVRFKL
ncbi:TonB-dependent receptor [Brevundimonas sp. FT23042]|uniref:TonB-dependent receptor n=1 Tax=Brevundimonas sp. FT23042 TaxID=3393749 RepID=UPI003B589EBB